MEPSDLDLVRLRSQGYRLTPQRLAILRVLRNAGRHLTPAEIYQLVREDIPGLTEATVYRTMIFLVEQGLVLVAHVGHGQLVYEIADHDHHQLICRVCGQEREVDHLELKALYEGFLDRTGYQMDTIHATFYGLCPDCQKERHFREP